ncbi:hypothetical protein HDU98_011907 [Podochytrium sp. JEL0797]|nr:hypothetical protein HDU98_011907 [Podochytrium sp. JEL0797]
MFFLRTLPRTCLPHSLPHSLALPRSFSTLSPDAKAALVSRVLKAKEHARLSFDDIAKHCGVTNLYASQLFMNQAQLKPETAEKLQALLPAISNDDLALMKKAPIRSFDPLLIQEPTIYRLNEAVNHYGHSIKAIINEKCGDGIMSAIDMYSRVDIIKGVHGEDRVVITLSGKFLPYIEQLEKNDMSKK